MWNVYNASHVLVAIYTTQGAAAAHVAAWPALYYRQAQSPAPSDTGPSTSTTSV